jgi:hypothetical protein
MHTVMLCNIHRFSIANLDERKRVIVTLYTHCLCCNISFQLLFAEARTHHNTLMSSSGFRVGSRQSNRRALEREYFLLSHNNGLV